MKADSVQQSRVSFTPQYKIIDGASDRIAVQAGGGSFGWGA